MGCFLAVLHDLNLSLDSSFIVCPNVPMSQLMDFWDIFMCKWLIVTSCGNYFNVPRRPFMSHCLNQAFWDERTDLIFLFLPPFLYGRSFFLSCFSLFFIKCRNGAFDFCFGTFACVVY